MVPKSYPNLPAGFVERNFQAITASEIKAPVSRDPRRCPFDQEMFKLEMTHRLLNATSEGEKDVLSTADLNQPQLFDIDNKTLGLPEPVRAAGLALLVGDLTARCMTISRSLQASMFGISKSVEMTSHLIALNQRLGNTDWVDRLIWRMLRLNKQQATMIKDNSEMKQKSHNLLQKAFWSNIDHLRVSIGIMPVLCGVGLGEKTQAVFQAVRQYYIEQIPKVKEE